MSKKSRGKTSPKQKQQAETASNSRVTGVLLGIVGVVVVGLIALRVLASGQPSSGQGAATAPPTGVASTPMIPAANVLPVSSLAQIPPGRADHVEVIYFHLSQRCYSCLTAERLTRQTVEQYFKDRIEAGDMNLAIVDVQDSANTGVAQRYGAWGPSLFLGVFKGDTQYIWHASDTYVALNNDGSFMAILSDRINKAFGVS